jgi:hypothetical protein
MLQHNDTLKISHIFSRNHASLCKYNILCFLSGIILTLMILKSRIGFEIHGQL